jgi:hypothetical protein
LVLVVVLLSLLLLLLLCQQSPQTLHVVSAPTLQQLPACRCFPMFPLACSSVQEVLPAVVPEV